jgi:predicted DNA-binding transcriptional regulator AlpA
MTNSVVVQKFNALDHAIDAQAVAAVLGIPRRSIYHFVRKGTIPHFHIGGCLMFDPGTLAAWFAKQGGAQ